MTPHSSRNLSKGTVSNMCRSQPFFERVLPDFFDATYRKVDPRFGTIRDLQSRFHGNAELDATHCVLFGNFFHSFGHVRRNNHARGAFVEKSKLWPQVRMERDVRSD